LLEVGEQHASTYYQYSDIPAKNHI